MRPTTNGVNSFDAAVLLEKAILLNGMLAHGTPEQKVYAKSAWNTLSATINQHTNVDACEMAKRELALDHENIDLHTLNFACK